MGVPPTLLVGDEEVTPSLPDGVSSPNDAPGSPNPTVGRRLFGVVNPAAAALASAHALMATSMLKLAILKVARCLENGSIYPSLRAIFELCLSL